MSLSLPRGTRDYSPREAISLRNITSKVEEVFRRFGFYPLDTPSLELMEILSAKAYGDESTKEIYVLEGKEEGLRYDLTVPLARHISMNKDAPLPFKRYQIDKIWRMDEPQHMRSREIIQADIDIIGSSELISDVEAIGATAIAIEAVGIKDYTILLSSRLLLDAILDLFEVGKEKHKAVIRLLDKLDKLGTESVSRELGKAGIDNRKRDNLLNFIKKKMENAEKLDKLVTNAPSAQPEIKRLKSILELLGSYNMSGKVSIDFSLARGLDYYTSTIWEFVSFEKEKKLPAIAAGGRYDNLVSLFSKKSIPAVGSSIGISRVFYLLGSDHRQKTYARVHMAYIKDENLNYALFIANRMRLAGIYVDLELTKRSLSKQLEYANSLGIPYVSIIGNQEREMNKLKLRNMLSGEEELLSIEEAIAKLKA